jgi:hypothetical protein
VGIKHRYYSSVFKKEIKLWLFADHIDLRVFIVKRCSNSIPLLIPLTPLERYPQHLSTLKDSHLTLSWREKLNTSLDKTWPGYMNVFCICFYWIGPAALLKFEAFIGKLFPFKQHLIGFWCGNVSLRAKDRMQWRERVSLLLFNPLWFTSNPSLRVQVLVTIMKIFYIF